MSKAGTKTSLLKSAGVIGGTQFVNLLIGIIRTKVIALLLGPTGVGLSGFYTSAIELVRKLSGFGINYSGVKEIASANSGDDVEGVRKAATVLRFWSLLTGVIGVVIILAFAEPLSVLFFKTTDYISGLRWVSITVLLGTISAGQVALLQGLKEIKKMAAATLWGTILSTILVIPIYWYFGENGIVPGIIVVSCVTLILSFYFVRKIRFASIRMSFADKFIRGLGMARLGFSIVVSGLISTLTIFWVRKIIIENAGVDGLGNFQAVWNMTNMYMGLILNAMLADFLPTLSSHSENNDEINSITNTQLEIALLIGGALVVALIGFSSLVIKILYSDKFVFASDLLQWQMVGALLVFFVWPIGVIYLAKSKGGFAILSDVIWCLVYLATIYWAWPLWGFLTLGIAFVIANIVKLITVFIIVNLLTGFTPTSVNLKHFLVFLILSIIAIIFNQYVVVKHVVWVNAILVTFASLYAFKEIDAIDMINKFIQRVK